MDRRRLTWIVTGLIAGFLVGQAAEAASVRREAPSQAYVGVPFTLSLVVDRAAVTALPEAFDIPGLEVLDWLARGSSSSQIVINGRVIEQSVTYSARLVARRPGTLEIPVLEVNTDQGVLRTRPIAVRAIEAESGDALEARIEADRDHYYVGEAVELRLLIWIKPFASERLNVELSGQEMLQQVDARRSAFGVFSDGLNSIALSEVEREGGDGRPARYYQYEVRVRLTPERPGPLVLDGNTIVMDYPESLARERGFFGRTTTTVDRSRLLVARVPPRTFQVSQPPDEGRPPWFNGAVGQFRFDTSASPTDVGVGDPITLSMVVTDRTKGGARLDVLEPPPLERVAELSDAFRLSVEPAAGALEGRRKRFERTIRAAHDDVARIPAIPFAYFDPLQRSYVTLWSDPIDLSVRSAGTLAMSDIVGAAAAAREGAGLTEMSGGVLANYGDPAALLAAPQVLPRPWLWVLLAVPPVLWAASALGVHRLRKVRGDSRLARRRTARRTAERRLAGARNHATAVAPDVVAAAVAGYVADRCDLPAGVTTCAEVVRTLERAGAGRDLIEQVRTLLSDCEQRVYAAAANGDGDGLAARASDCLRRLERERLSS